ncbi:MAG: hypothetical protein ACREEI_11095 [Stellaceae bacterium]
MNALDEPGALRSPAQSELFGDGTPTSNAYVPDQRHLRNRLANLIAQMQAAKTWPWEPVIVRLHREKTFSYLCDLLADPKEAADWRTRIEAEIARLDAAAR